MARGGLTQGQSSGLVRVGAVLLPLQTRASVVVRQKKPQKSEPSTADLAVVLQSNRDRYQRTGQCLGGGENGSGLGKGARPSRKERELNALRVWSARAATM